MGEWERARPDLTPKQIDERCTACYVAVYQEHEPNSTGTKEQRLAAIDRAKEAANRVRARLVFESKQKAS
jgi:hypothetical protein